MSKNLKNIMITDILNEEKMSKKLKKCSICGIDRYKDSSRGLSWKSNLVIETDHMKARITVCPDCRKLSLVDILVKTHFGAYDIHNRGKNE